MKLHAQTAPDRMRIGYWIAVLLVGVCMTYGLGAFARPELGWFAGYLFGLLLTILIEFLFAASLLKWWQERSTGALIGAIIFGFVSMICNVPTLFSFFIGHELTVQNFIGERDHTDRELTAAYNQVNAAAKGALALSAYAANMQMQEGRNGGTCNVLGGGDKERYRYRKRQAEEFAVKARTFSQYAAQLSGIVKNARSIRPETTDSGLRNGLRALNTNIADASAITNDPGLRGLGTFFAIRASHDGDPIVDPITKVTFECPDATVSSGERAIAQQIASLPKLEEHVAIPNFTDVHTTMMELPGRIIATLTGGIGAPNGLSGDDATAVFISCIFEAVLIAATLLTHERGGMGRRLSQAAGRAEELRNADFSSVLAAGRRLPPDLGFLIEEIERYRWPIWPIELVLVAHGCRDEGLRRLADALPAFCALGLASRYPFLPGWMVRHRVRQSSSPSIQIRRSWFARVFGRSWAPYDTRPWPSEMRSAARFEVFRIDMKAMDQYCLAARLQADDRTEPADGPGAGDPDTMQGSSASTSEAVPLAAE